MIKNLCCNFPPVSSKILHTSVLHPLSKASFACAQHTRACTDYTDKTCALVCTTPACTKHIHSTHTHSTHQTINMFMLGHLSNVILIILWLIICPCLFCPPPPLSLSLFVPPSLPLLLSRHILHTATSIWLFPFVADYCNTIVKQLPAYFGSGSKKENDKSWVCCSNVFPPLLFPPKYQEL